LTELATSEVASSNTNGWLHTNIYAGGSLIATYDDDGAGPHFRLTDWLGTMRAQTNYAGALEQTCQSLPFGETPTPCYRATEQFFTGKERDTETGNDYFGARYYNSNVARWLSPDWDAKSSDPVPYAKLDEPQTLNLYGYLANNPLGGVDKDGHQWSWDKTKTALDVAGFIPVVGDFANLASAGISVAQGHYAEAAVSALAAIPVVGMVGEIGKGAELLKTAETVIHAEKEVGAAVRATEEGGTIFRRGAHDTQQLLTNQAGAAEKAGLPHGVSVSTSPAAKPGQIVRSASTSSVEEAGFTLHKTGSDPNHYTAQLPKPVTKKIAETWNALFK
jgi:RHS repeat-associated protein